MGCYLKSASIILALALAFIVFPHFANFRAEESSEPLVLEHADQLISSGGDGDIVNLLGNVHFKHDRADLFSHRATWYRKAGLIQFMDSVQVRDDNRRITSQSMTYYRRDRRITAIDGVRMVDYQQDAVLTSNRIDYYRDTKQFDAYGEPKLIFNPLDDTARMEIEAQRMSYFADEKRGEAIDSVVITRNNLVARAGRADFIREPEQVVLTGKPVIIQDENELSGDSVSIFTEKRKIQRLVVRGDAKALYRTLPDSALQEYTTAEIQGRELEAFFEDDRISQMVTRRNATSLYDPAITDTLISGTNLASGDSITLFFNNGIIKRVMISGGAQGQFIEPKYDKGEPYFDTTRYSADMIDYNFDNAEIKLLKNGNLRYRDMELKSGDIRYNTDSKILVAQPLDYDSAGGANESPLLKQGPEELFGDRMSYNLETRKGQVRMARTKFEGGYYSGQAIRQASEDVLFVSRGDFTSCDLPEPHYVFYSSKMKMVGKDKVVARPVVLYIGRLPVFAVPYYVFPIRKGRHSGFLPFDIGNFERGERFIRNVGYYWAASEYWDAYSSLDFYENSRTIMNGGLHYSIRYKLSGNVAASYTRSTSWDRTRFVESFRNRWSFRFSHNQTISPTVNLSGSGQFLSDKSYIEDNVFDPSERLNRSINSDMSLNKRWRNSSLAVVASQNWNLDTDERRELLPSVRFSRSSLPIFPEPSATEKKERIRPGEEIEAPQKRFYHSIYFSASSTAQNLRNRLKLNDSTYTQRNYQTMGNQAGLTAPQKILGILTVNPGINITQNIARVEKNRTTDSLGLEAGKIVSQEKYSLSIGANTSVYGTIFPNVYGITGIRHVMTPTVTYSFSPEVRHNQRYLNYVGLGGFSRRSKTLSFGLTNLFQTKYLAGETERKLDLFSLNFSGSYNFAADSLRFSNIGTSLRTSAIPRFNLDYTASHSLYELNRNKFRPWQNPRLISQSISASTSFSLKSGGAADQGAQDQDDFAQRAYAPRVGTVGQFSGVGLSGTLNYSYTESRGTIKSINQKATLNLDGQPTKNWRVSYFCHYDIKTKRIESQSVNIGRDLHCWQAVFSWVPSGRASGYFVRINIKSLPAIKIEKSEGISTPGGGGYF
jgi:lipopolysaccharide assembly outer membrane protein LptD (OstA)